MISTTTKNLRKREVFINENQNYSKRFKYFDHTTYLPEEIVVHIFSFLSQEELCKSVRFVCKRWYTITFNPLLWKKITARREIPSSILCKWIEHSPLLKQLNLKGRNDVNLVTERVTKCCRNLESLRIENSRGTKKSSVMKSKYLCNLLTKCKYLHNIHFSGVVLQSCKFFKLFSKRRYFGTKRRCSYYGPVNHKQMKALIESIVSSDIYEAATLFTSGNRKISLKNQSGGTINNELNVLDTMNNIWKDVHYFNQNAFPMFDEEDDDDDYLPYERNNARW